MFLTYFARTKKWVNRRACKGWIPSTPLESEDTFSGDGQIKMKVGLCWILFDYSGTKVNEIKNHPGTKMMSNMSELLVKIAFG